LKSNETLRRYLLQHAHPAKFAAEILGILASGLLLWNHQWIATVLVALTFFLLSTLLLWREHVNVEKLVDTPLGKIMLPYATPLNFFLYNFSAVPLVYGLWKHSIFFILIGVIILILPQLEGKL